ncbi:LuxR C-terminal-related transcriptional regulator [Streptomyces sp. SL13]|uniref:LuxR C-terminal-related transcriptional regulator n=1 Tax=Streptantibioticus silvisoli TaxID=2705255 RepID=A0AA90H0Z3_9ACTN|nr:LuxR family transcriptional regulator [Streptantibioticus silvisoli]MDI5969361.1 LuxR C-terminal-related transcriptional regulator [Streptantibioticus silvisoli]
MRDGRCQLPTQLPHTPSEGPTANAANDRLDNPLARSLSAWLAGEVRRAIELAAAPGGDEHDPRLAKIWHARLLTRVRELPEATRLLDELTTSCDVADDAGVSAALTTCRAEFALASGDAGSAFAEANIGLGLAEGAGAYTLLPDLHVVLALSAVRQSDTSTGLRFARNLGDDALLGRTAHVPGQCVWAAAQAFEADGGPAGVSHLVERLIADDQLTRELFASQPAAAAWHVRLARSMGDERLAFKCVVQAESLTVKSWGFRSPHAAALHAEGLFEKDPDKLRAACELYSDGWASASAAEDLARTWSSLRLGQDRAVEQLKRAAVDYERAGAARDLARVASKLRDLGVRSGRVRRPMRHDGHRTGSLTDTEFAVANLVSRGLTNVQVGRQLYISAHTVAFHLKKIFRKMEVSSRVELACTWVNLTSDQRTAG